MRCPSQTRYLNSRPTHPRLIGFATQQTSNMFRHHYSRLVCNFCFLVGWVGGWQPETSDVDKFTHFVHLNDASCNKVAHDCRWKVNGTQTGVGGARHYSEEKQKEHKHIFEGK